MQATHALCDFRTEINKSVRTFLAGNYGVENGVEMPVGADGIVDAEVGKKFVKGKFNYNDSKYTKAHIKVLK